MIDFIKRLLGYPYCSNNACKAVLKEDAKYCHKCGNKVGDPIPFRQCDHSRVMPYQLGELRDPPSEICMLCKGVRYYYEDGWSEFGQEFDW